MFGWASEQIEKLAQTVAPPPSDAVGRFLYSVQRGDETNAQGSLAEFTDPGSTIVQPTKGNIALHLACLNGMEQLIRQLMSMPNANIQVTDNMGNTPLHYACMSNLPASVAFNTVRLLVTQFQASVVAKNRNGETPYDVASINSVRQYLLPLQLQQETQHALDNGGVGLPPGIDLGGLHISNSHRPPPPIGGVSSPQPSGRLMATPLASAQNFQKLGATPDFSAPQLKIASQPDSVITVPPAVSSASNPSNDVPHLYARSGHSSLAVGQSKYRPDGFHSSSSDVNLQRKYGHIVTGVSGIAPPPSSGNAIGPPPSSLGTNPYARGNAQLRYIARGCSAEAPSSGGYGYMPPPVPAAIPNVTTFMPTAPKPQNITNQQHQAQQRNPALIQKAQTSPPMRQPNHYSRLQPTERGISQPAAAPQSQPTSVKSSYFPPPPISIVSQSTLYQTTNPTTLQAISHPVTKSQPDPVNNPLQAESVFGNPSSTTNTAAITTSETQPPILSQQPVQHSISSLTNSAQDLFAKPSQSNFTKEDYNENSMTNADVANNKSMLIQNGTSSASEYAIESEANELEDSMDGMQDIPLFQDDRVELVIPTKQEEETKMLAENGGLPPPPYFNKK